MRGLVALRGLDLRSNGIVALPAWLAEPPALERLDLRWNRLAAAEPVALAARGCRVLI
jgi:Leucine-rich repeat (LRR) protein